MSDWIAAITGLARSPQEALVLGMLIAAAVAFVFAGLLSWRRCSGIWTDLLIPASFLAAYYLVYNKVPTFPPVGAVNKVFYVALAGAAVGFLAELFRNKALARALLFLQPIAVAAYIGSSQLTVAPFEVAAAALCGLLALCLLSAKMAGTQGEADIKRAILLAIVCVGFAPIAFAGASSSSFQLSLFLAAAICAILLWNFANPNFSFASASLMGAAGGMVAVAQTVTLITRKTDLAALAVLGLAFLAPQFNDRVLGRIPIHNKAARIAIFVGLCLPPVCAAVAIVFVRHLASFPI